MVLREVGMGEREHAPATTNHRPQTQSLRRLSLQASTQGKTTAPPADAAATPRVKGRSDCRQQPGNGATGGCLQERFLVQELNKICPFPSGVSTCRSRQAGIPCETVRVAPSSRRRRAAQRTGERRRRGGGSARRGVLVLRGCQPFGSSSSSWRRSHDMRRRFPADHAPRCRGRAANEVGSTGLEDTPFPFRENSTRRFRRRIIQRTPHGPRVRGPTVAALDSEAKRELQVTSIRRCTRSMAAGRCTCRSGFSHGLRRQTL